MDRWRGKTAIVTGASSGIGANVACKLVEEGLQVVGLARRLEKVEALAHQLKGKPGKLYAVRADVTKEEDILRAFKWTTDNVGVVHILINNAGVYHNTSLIDGDTNLWRNVIDTNLMGLCISTKEALRIMNLNNINGHIIHMNSIAGHKVISADMPTNVYSASKFGVTALTEALRLELNNANSKIKVTSISPGLVRSEMTKMLRDKTDIAILEEEDISNAVVYVLSTPPGVLIQELTIRPIGEQF